MLILWKRFTLLTISVQLRLDLAGGDLTEIIDAFANSEEAQALYGDITEDTIGTVIDAIYQAAFNRAPDEEGKNYYINGFKEGKFTPGTIALDILNGAKNDDAIILQNKLESALNFTKAIDPELDGKELLATYEGDDDAQAGRDFLKEVGVTADTVKDSSDAVKFIQEKIADPGDAIEQQTSGQTFTLTTGIDNVAGTSGNDTINGTNATLNLGDVIDGGNGTDTLYIGDTGSTSGVNFNLATIKNVENLIYQAANGAANTLNLAGLAGLQTVTYQDLNTAAQNVTINTKGNATSVTVKNAAAVTVSDTATTDTLASVTVDGNTGAANITSDALSSLSVANTNQNVTVTAAAGTRSLDVTVNNVTGGTITDAQATSVTVSGTGAASSGFTLTTDAATSVAFAGDKTISVTLADTGSNSAVVSSITSTNTAGVTIASPLGNAVSFTGGSGNDTVEVAATTKAIAMGDGDDTVKISTGNSALGSGGSLDGGAGTDTIAMDADDAATATATSTFAGSISNFEVLDLNGAASAAVTVNLANLDNIDKVKISADIGNVLTINNIASGGTVTFAAAQTAASTVNVLNATTNTTDVLNLGVSSNSGINVQTITAANVETINLNTDDSAATPSGIQHTMTLTAGAAKTLNVSGDAGVALTLTGSTALETIDTSGVTKGAVSVTTVGTGSVTMTGGDTNTTFNASSVAANKVATITTGAGNDVIIGGAGDDVINAGNGTNTITGGGGKDTMTGGTGVDTYVYTAVTDSQGTKVDVITNFQVGTGGDVIDVSVISATPGVFLGTANGYGAVLTSLVADSKTNAVFDSSTSTLYIDVNGDGALDNNDMAIQLTGVTTGLVAANFVL